MTMPTVGRKLWFFQSAQHALEHSAGRHEAQPFDATVTFVHSDRCVNVRVCDHTGNTNMGLGVTLRQDGDPPANGPHCQWMPYQVAQAKKEEVASQIMAVLGNQIQQSGGLSAEASPVLIPAPEPATAEDTVHVPPAATPEPSPAPSEPSIPAETTPAPDVDNPGTPL